MKTQNVRNVYGIETELNYDGFTLSFEYDHSEDSSKPQRIVLHFDGMFMIGSIATELWKLFSKWRERDTMRHTHVENGLNGSLSKR